MRKYSWLLLLFAYSCGDDDAARCVPGTSVACVGVGGCAGGQVCNAAGTGFEACICAADGGVPDVALADVPMADAQTLDGDIPDADGADARDSGIGDASGDAADAFDGGLGCDLITNAGCSPDQRCRSFVKPDDSIRSECVPNGSVAPGGACTTTDGVDDCARVGAQNYFCGNGECIEICDSEEPESCSDSVACRPGFADGVPIGLCYPSCDLIAQECGPGQGCFLAPEGTICTSAPEPAPRQDEACTGPITPGVDCFLNGCAAGFGPWTFVGDVRACAAYCRAADTHVGDTTQAAGIAPNACQSGEQCRFLSVYPDMASDDNLGFCVTPNSGSAAAAVGDCRLCDISTAETLVATCSAVVALGCVSTATAMEVIARGETVCDDGSDGDFDGATDCDDNDCAGVAPCP